VNEAILSPNLDAHVVPFGNDLVDEVRIDSLQTAFARHPKMPLACGTCIPEHFQADGIRLEPRNELRDWRSKRSEASMVLFYGRAVTSNDKIVGAGHFHCAIDDWTAEEALLESRQFLWRRSVIEGDTDDGEEIMHKLLS
jgi:hypothetical protein